VIFQLQCTEASIPLRSTAKVSLPSSLSSSAVSLAFDPQLSDCLRTITILQGGEEIAEEERGILTKVLSTDVTSKLFIALATASALPCAIMPETGAKLYGFEVKRGTLSSFFLQGTGFVAVGTAITAFLSTTSMTSIGKAIAFGLIPRFVWAIKGALDGSFDKFKMKNKLLILGSCAVKGAILWPLLAGNSYPMVTAKVIAAYTGLVSLITMISPGDMLNLAVDADSVKEGKTILYSLNIFSSCCSSIPCLIEEEEQQTSVMVKMFGQQILISAVHIGSLSLGVEPIAALSYASVAASANFLESILAKDYDKLGTCKGCCLGFFLTALAFAIRFRI